MQEREDQGLLGFCLSLEGYKSVPALKRWFSVEKEIYSMSALDHPLTRAELTCGRCLRQGVTSRIEGPTNPVTCATF